MLAPIATLTALALHLPDRYFLFVGRLVEAKGVFDCSRPIKLNPTFARRSRPGRGRGRPRSYCPRTPRSPNQSGNHPLRRLRPEGRSTSLLCPRRRAGLPDTQRHLGIRSERSHGLLLSRNRQRYRRMRPRPGRRRPDRKNRPRPQRTPNGLKLWNTWQCTTTCEEGWQAKAPSASPPTPPKPAPRESRKRCSSCLSARGIQLT